MFTCYKANGDILLVFESIHRQRVVSLSNFDPKFCFFENVLLYVALSSFKNDFSLTRRKIFSTRSKILFGSKIKMGSLTNQVLQSKRQVWPPTPE